MPPTTATLASDAARDSDLLHAGPGDSIGPGESVGPSDSSIFADTSADSTADGVRFYAPVDPPAAAPSPVAPADPLPMVQLMGVEIHAVTEQRAIAHILEQLSFGRGGVTVTPNLDHLRRCRDDLQFASLVAEAELVVPDGMPLIWASRLAGCPLPERVAGSDLILTLSAAAAEAGRSIFLLGGAPGTAEGAADVLRARHPSLAIVGTYCPPLGFEENETEMAKVVATLTAARPDIIFVALGSPKQEILIERIRTTLPRAWWLGVGVSFSFLTGHVQRAPRWIQAIGMEWIHRLLQEPRRLFKRYVMQGLPFAASMVADALGQRTRTIFGDAPSRCHVRQNRSARASLPYLTGTSSVETSAVPAARSVVADGIRGTRDTQSGGALRRLKAVVLLSGQLRPSPLMMAAQRSVLDLPIGADRTLLQHWIADVGDLARHAKLDRLPARVLVSRPQDQPGSHAGLPAMGDMVTVELDASALRGTGGVLSDITRGYDDDDFVLVANAAQLLLEPLSVLATTLDNKRADIALINHLDGTPGGLLLIRCATLRKISTVGFIDLKEQALPTIAKDFDVRVVNCRRPTGLTLRTSADYIGALRQYHRGAGRLPGSRRGQLDPLAEGSEAAFSIVERGALVHPSAIVHDSIVLRGGRVEAGAAIVRALVAPNVVVKRDGRLMDGAYAA